MSPRLLQYSDVETAFDRPERVGRLAGTVAARRDEGTVVAGTGDTMAPGALAIRTAGRHVLPFYRRVGPDVETFGNHEFDHGLDALGDVVARSPVEWLSANVRSDGEGLASVAPGTTVEREGERIGFVGVTDPDSWVPPSLTVTDPVNAVRKARETLPPDDHLVVLAHVRQPHGETIARETPADVVLAGHTHAIERRRVDDALLVRPGENGEVVWEVSLDGGRPTATRHDVPDGPLDEGLADDLRGLQAEHGLAEVVARVEDPIPRDREGWLRGEARLPNFVADAYRWATGADAAVFNTGSLRTGDPIEGAVTVGDLVSLAPFEADLRVVGLSGARLRRLVDHCVETSETWYDDDWRDLWVGHVSGLTVERHHGEAIRAVRLDGDPLDEDRTYRVAVPAIVVYSDRRFDAVTPDDVLETGDCQTDALVAYARRTGVEASLDGRIRYVGR